MNVLETAIRNIKDLELIQYGEFPLAGDVGRIQIVFATPMPTTEDVLKLRYSPQDAAHPYRICERKIRQILKVCREIGVSYDVRIVAKSLNIGVVSAIYSIDAVKNYQNADDIEKIASDWSRASRFL